jgi:hypothetical protein
MRCFWYVYTENSTNLSSQVSSDFRIGPRLTPDNRLYFSRQATDSQSVAPHG